jgi:hypothetical protein
VHGHETDLIRVRDDLCRSECFGKTLASGGARIAWYGSLTSIASIQFVRNVLLTCGWDGVSWTNLRGIDRRAVSLVVEEERDPKGVIRARLKYINAEASVMMKEGESAQPRLDIDTPSERGCPAVERTVGDRPGKYRSAARGATWESHVR